MSPKKWDPRYMDQYGRFIGNIADRLAEIAPDRNYRREVEYAPKGYKGDRIHCVLCMAWLDRYVDGLGNHWLDSMKYANCPDGTEHQRSTRTGAVDS